MLKEQVNKDQLCSNHAYKGSKIEASTLLLYFCWIYIQPERYLDSTAKHSPQFIQNNKMPTHKICPDGDTTITLTTTKNPTKLLVSSHHLINASPYYRALLTGPFREASILRANGTVNITLPDDNPTAMIAVMNAVHGRFFSVPGRKIKLELLKDIAVVVDKYELFESVSTVLHTWASTVRIGNPRASLRDVAKWILCVSWVFNMSDAFRFATKELVLDTGVDVELEGTCVPLNVGGEFYLPVLLLRLNANEKKSENNKTKSHSSANHTL